MMLHHSSALLGGSLRFGLGYPQRTPSHVNEAVVLRFSSLEGRGQSQSKKAAPSSIITFILSESLRELFLVSA